MYFTAEYYMLKPGDMTCEMLQVISDTRHNLILYNNKKFQFFLDFLFISNAPFCTC